MDKTLIQKRCHLVSPKRRFAILSGYLDNYIELAKYTIHINKVNYCRLHGYDLYNSREIRPEYNDHQTHASGHSWSRLHDMLDLVECGKYDWVWCVGCDTLITNMTLPLDVIVNLAETKMAEQEPLPQYSPPPDFSVAPKPVVKYEAPPGHPMCGRKHFLICAERVTTMQADSFLVRCSPEGAHYLRDILCHYGLYHHHPWVENQTMIDLRNKHAAITYMVPQWRMNSYDYRRFEHFSPLYKDGTDCFGNRGQWAPGDFLIHWPAASLEQRFKWLNEYWPKIVY